MKRITIPILLFLFSLQLHAQGDFELQKNDKRQFATAVADTNFKSGSKFFLGKNYRNEWTHPVNAPVLNFKNDFGGLTPKKEGGGKETHSLQLEDTLGRKWVLRSVRKYPEKIIPNEIQKTIAEKIIKQEVSASYPYGVLSVGTLAKAAQVPYMPNTLVYLPDDEILGDFRSKFKNTLSFLELRSVALDDNKKAEALSTEEMVQELQSSNKNTVDQLSVLRLRLLDNFMMDFDRHEGQWEWVHKDSAGRAFYFPIPKDRDQVFFKSDGFLLNLLTHAKLLEQLQGLRPKIRDVDAFNFAAANFDRTYLTQLDEQTWNNEVDKLLASLSDTVIESALSKQPKEIQQYSTQSIISILKAKRSFFKNDMMNYYRALSKIVSITGTNDDDQFIITKNENGSVLVQVQPVDTAGGTSFIIYQRLFDPSITKEIQIYGLEGNDKFIVRGGESQITIRLIGGPGNDTFINEGAGKILVYDLSAEDNTISGVGMKNKISSDPLVNEYRRMGHQYNISGPGISFEYSTDGGLFLGPKWTMTKYAFRKEPYSIKQSLAATTALNSSSWHFKYNADFIGAFGKTDLLIRTDVKLPTVRTNFFGLGNETQFDKTHDGQDYYHVHYNSVDMSIMGRNTITSAVQIKYGGVLQNFRLLNERNNGKYINTISSPTINKDGLYSGLWYAGAEGRLEVNTRNNAVMPTKGIYLNVYGRSLFALSNDNNVSQAGGSFSFYQGILNDHVVLAASFGADKTFGNFDFPLAQYLGLKQGLRGYRIQRFAGRSRAYNNTELRIKFAEGNFYLFKGDYGILCFHDVGRVWVDKENSDKWHTGYGGGIWVAPLNKLVIIGALTFSEEEKRLAMLSFSFQF